MCCSSGHSSSLDWLVAGKWVLVRDPPLNGFFKQLVVDNEKVVCPLHVYLLPGSCIQKKAVPSHSPLLLKYNRGDLCPAPEYM